jgi:hypothetical protein
MANVLAFFELPNCRTSPGWPRSAHPGPGPQYIAFRVPDRATPLAFKDHLAARGD